jgi:predicted Zn-dependent protease
MQCISPSFLRQNRPLALAIIAQTAIIFIALCAGGNAVAQADQGARRSTSTALPNLGDGGDMTPGAERRLGDRIARELYRDPDYVDDPVIMEYVQAIWKPLLAAARLRGELPAELDEAYAWEILLGRDRTVNAFALPGAYMGLHLGLVGVVTSRDELASVMAHELSHVTQRHISRMISRQSGVAPWLMGAMILGVLAASKSPGAANAMIIGGQAAAAQGQLNFSRDMEREADRIGFGVMSQAGFAPQGFVTMFEKLQQANRLNDSGGFPYLRSHPLSTERMADMQDRIPRGGAATPAGASTNAPELDQSMIAARARVLSNASVDALRVWPLQAEATQLARLTPPQQAGTLYGACLAALKLRDFAQATSLWSRLSAQVASDAAAARLARLLGAELALAQGDSVRALGRLAVQSPEVGGQPGSSRAELFLRVQAQLQSRASGHPMAQTAQQLQTWLADHPRDAQAWQLLSSAYAAQGRTLGAIRAEAEVNVAQLDYAAAHTRLKAAQELIGKGGIAVDHIEASIVDTRTRQIEQLLRENPVER